jgi:molecular chaperone DnaJ
MAKDYYKILEVDRAATQEEIKKAYRKQAMRYHPDKNGGDQQSEEKFKECAEAFDILSDPQKKQQYDTYGEVGDRGNPFSGGFGGFGMDDIFSRFGDIFGFGGGSSQRQTRRGNDLRMTLKISLNDIINGISKTIKYNRNIKCKPCDGQGGTDFTNCGSCSGTGQRRIVQQTPFGNIQQVMPCNYCEGRGKVQRNTCNTCRGQGTIPNEESLDLNVPKGAIGGISFAMQEKGNWIKSGSPGDLVIIIDEEPNVQFKRDGINLTFDNNITVIEAILGKEQTLDTPHGKIKFNIQPGTQHGNIIRIQGKGIPDIQRNGFMGDLLIKIAIKIPSLISNEEKMILEDLKNSENFN